jgi:hypothetical protein
MLHDTQDKVFVIGSHALSHHLGNIIPNDVDVLVTDVWYFNQFGNIPTSFRSQSKQNQVYEYNVVSKKSPYISDALVYEYLSLVELDKCDFIQNGYYASLEVIKALKLSCYKHLNKDKHLKHLDLLKDIVIDDVLSDIVRIREREVIQRVKVQKDSFFNKYHIQRVVEHDDLHKVFTDRPIYERLLIDSVTPEENKFYNLSKEEQCQVVMEEVAVLVTERYSIPNIIKNPLSSAMIIREMSRWDSNPVDYWVNRFGTNMHDHPKWLAKWTLDNKKEIACFLKERWYGFLTQSTVINFLNLVQQKASHVALTSISPR